MIPVDQPSGGGFAGGMTGGLGRLRQQATSLVSGFTSGQKAMTIIAAIGVVIGGYAFVSWAGKATYAPLFSNLSASDAAAITSKLNSAKIPYQLADAGATILVPQNDVYQERLNLSAAGLPGDTNSGYALLNKAGITTSQFQQQVDYQQAVQSELDKTIQAMQGVTAAVVHVVIPQDNLFTTTNQPSASVLVEMSPGQSLNATQVQAIVHLVASSIENLDPNNVTVVDDKGDVLSAPGSEGAALAAGDAQSQQTQAFDTSLGTTLTNMLVPVLGANNAVVHVSADLNYDQQQTTSKTFDPNKTGPIPVSSASQTEQYTGAGAAAAAGTLGQTTTATTVAGSNGTGTYNQNSTSNNAVVSEVDQTIQSAPGTIKRLSVAVEVNKSVKGITSAQIQGIVSAAAGLLPSRGDTIQVTLLPFDTTAQKTATAELKAAAAAKSSAAMMSTVRTAVILLAVVGLLVYSLRRLTKTTRTDLALPDGWDPLELQAASSPLDMHSTRVLEPAGVPGVGRNRAVAELANQDPVQIANLLRDWLAEEA